MPKFLVTSGSHFEPFSYDELVKPVAQAQEAHNAAREQADTLAMQAGAIGSMLDDSSPRAKKLYDNFMESADALVEDLSMNGYNSGTANTLSKLRRMYGVDITKVNAAITQKSEAVKNYDEDIRKDKTLITERDPRTMSVDNWLDDPYAGTYKSYSGALLTAKASAIGENLRRDIIENQDVWKSILGGQYFERNEFVGFHAREIRDAIKGLLAGEASTDERVKLLQSAMETVYSSSGMGEWATPEQQARALNYIGDGIYSAIGDNKNSIQQNRDFMSEYQRRTLALKEAATRGRQDNPTVTPGIAQLRGNKMGHFADRKQDKELQDKRTVRDALDVLNRLRKSGALRDPETGAFVDAANDAILALKESKYWEQLSGKRPDYLQTTDLDALLETMNKDIDKALKNDHMYTLNITPAAASNLARNTFKLNIGQLSGKNGDNLAAGVASYYNGDAVKARDLLELLDSDNLSVGFDAKNGKITVQRMGADDSESRGKYDDRVVCLDTKAVLTGTSGYANAAQILYALDSLMPEYVSYAARKKTLNQVAAMTTAGQTVSLPDLADLIHGSYVGMMQKGSNEDKVVFNALVEAFCLGMFDSSNAAWSPNNYIEGWSAKQLPQGLVSEDWQRYIDYDDIKELED